MIADGRGVRDAGAERFLSPRQHAAALEMVRRVRAGVPAALVGAYLFGSRARGEARPDSDVDVLLVFHRLPPDREPQAGMAERIAEGVAEESGVPVTPWSVSLPDLERGERTPMLVDALEDSVPLWPREAPDLRVPFTPEDALFCVGALLRRVEEGSDEVRGHRRAGDREGAARRLRDDLVRLFTAALLLEGETRPRRAQCVARFRGRCLPSGAPAPRPALLAWAAASFGPRGDAESLPVPPPPGGMAEAARDLDALRAWVAARLGALARRGTGGGAGGYHAPAPDLLDRAPIPPGSVGRQGPYPTPRP